MKGLPFAFFAAAVIAVTCGMGLGIFMGASGDHSYADTHAHLNLIGWVTMALFGVYYQLTPQAARTTLARVHFAVALLGVVTIVPGIAIVTHGGTELWSSIGSLLTFASMLIFLFAVFRHGLGAGAGQGRSLPGGVPAE
ncbi:hypothetical protein [Wenxinia marina]|uniref:Uncharacterized protein n=1 Tax=Wenxinia marina DSM 24838 TaxID=1123501 RepID=A0A0D0QCK6_9RHOB|nr:hypothetical protein [Wenxinia marina]KIQ68663.1 hypothetical protein Wenmar_02934 [Wenxinia marina DSM 24838]GGL67749.1 hypothetical protein GCM10011392_22770 [Wenxinia marina]